MGILDKIKRSVKQTDDKATPKKKSGSDKGVVKSDKKDEKTSPNKSGKSAVKKVSSSKGSKSKKDDLSFSKGSKDAYKVLCRPIISEKTSLGVQNGKYVFQVATGSNKVLIKKAIKDLYKVEVEKVNIVVLKGKKVRFGRILGVRNNWKKAIITLKKGDSINIEDVK